MTQLNNIKCLTVANFFKTFNWQGSISGFPVNNQVKSENCLSLSVRDFFKQNNWDGRQIILNEPTSAEEPRTLSVKNFFSLIVWEGQQEISVLPKLTLNLDIMPQKNFSIEDLSDLF